MASIPPRYGSARRQSGSESSSAPQQGYGSRSSSNGHSSTPLLIKARSEDPGSSFSNAGSQTAEPSRNTEPRLCWICQQDDTEDTPDNSTWRTPCPCSLTAHEDCLLEWIANKETPKPGEVASPQQISCPQCKAEIQISRPKDYLVIAADKVHLAANFLMYPMALSAVVGCFYSGFFVYGMNTLRTVFGPEEAAQIVASSRVDPQWVYQRSRNTVFRAVEQLLAVSDPFLPHTDIFANWKVFAGLPLIGPALILSRTRLADQAFAILPISYFLFRPSHSHIRQWPPSPALALAALPYIRSTYNEIYRHTFADLEKQWDLAVQRKPREGETAEGIRAQQEEGGEGQGFIDFEMELVEVEVPGDPPIEIAVPGVAENNDGGNVGGAVGNVEGGADAQPEGAAPAPDVPQRREHNWELRQNVSTTGLVTKVMGALLFPAISAMMGDLLKLGLPATWCAKQGERLGLRFGAREPPRGLLQEKWGRTVVGGCLFVVLKDMISLYCKWKKARDFGKRKILDFEGKRNIRP